MAITKSQLLKSLRQVEHLLVGGTSISALQQYLILKHPQQCGNIILSTLQMRSTKHREVK